MTNLKQVLGKRWGFKMRVLRFLNEQTGWTTRTDIEEGIRTASTKDNKGFSKGIGEHTKSKNEWEPDSLLALNFVRFRLIRRENPQSAAEYVITPRGRELVLTLSRLTVEGKGQSKNRVARKFHLPEEISDTTGVPEGALRRIVVNAFERSPANRKRCIDHYKAICSVCRMEFGKTYGSVAAGYIHVHHLRQLSSVRGKHDVNPIMELAPVCPNCHAVIHMRDPPFEIDDVQRFLANAASDDGDD